MRPFAAVLVALLVIPAGAARSEPGQLPNLVPLPAFNLRIGAADEGPDDVLRFSVGIANRGDHAFDLHGIPELSIPEDVLDHPASAEQCMAWTAPYVCGTRTRVGTFRWHAAHQHWHLDAVALYELRSLDEDGSPDMDDDGLVASSGKVSFCLIDYQRDPEGSGSPLPFYKLCELGSQGISPGWMDTYHYDLPGQQIALDGVPDGDYAIVVTVDPDARLHESDDADNVSVARIRLSEGGTVVDPL